MAKLKFHTIPAGADPTRYRQGVKKDRKWMAEARRRDQIARRFSMTAEERALEDEHNAALKLSGQQFWQEYRDLGQVEASRLAQIRTDALKAEHQRKLDALPPDKRSDGTYDVRTFDFEAHQRAQNEAWEAKVRAMFPPADEEVSS
jgi:hypothetical protein